MVYTLFMPGSFFLFPIRDILFLEFYARRVMGLFGKMMNSYYYGKSGKGDFNRENLPKNRRQLFFEMLRVRFSGLFRLNLTAVLAFLPMLAVLSKLVSNLFTLMNIILTVESDMAAAAPEMLQIYQNRQDHLMSILFMSLIWLIPAIALTGPVQAGMAYVTRNWARDEHAFVWSDFKDAVKTNWKQALAVSSITAAVPFTMLLCWQFYSALAAKNMLFIVPQMLSLMLGLLWLLSVTFLYPMLVTYDMKFGQLVRNSLLLAVGRLPHTVATRLLCLAPALIAAAVALTTPYGLYALMLLGGYYLLLGNAMTRFIVASFTNAVFDKYINSRLEGVEVDRGLAREEDMDAEGDED